MTEPEDRWSEVPDEEVSRMTLGFLCLTLAAIIGAIAIQAKRRSLLNDGYLPYNNMTEDSNWVLTLLFVGFWGFFFFGGFLAYFMEWLRRRGAKKRS